MGQIRNLGSARSWLFTVLRNCFLKTRQRQPPLPATALRLNVDSIPDPLGGGRVDPIDPETLQEALNDLSGAFRLVLVMFYYENRSYREIAEALDLPMGTVMSRLARAKAQLRSRLVSADAPAPHRSPPAPVPKS
jgi:RNA polymerase sigma-70 factor (ECF subfamily)